MNQPVMDAAVEKVAAAFKPSMMPTTVWVSPIRYGYSSTDPNVRVLVLDVAPSRKQRKEAERIEISAADLMASVALKPVKTFRQLVIERVEAVIEAKGWGEFTGGTGASRLDRQWPTTSVDAG
jgi:hypothetical protein